MLNTELLSANQFVDDDNSAYDYIERFVNNNSPRDEYISDTVHVYPFIDQTDSSSISHRRFKRPSWATVGKRSSLLIKKRPSWAQVG